jgi:hypothetical protein
MTYLEALCRMAVSDAELPVTVGPADDPWIWKKTRYIWPWNLVEMYGREYLPTCCYTWSGLGVWMERCRMGRGYIVTGTPQPTDRAGPA